MHCRIVETDILDQAPSILVAWVVYAAVRIFIEGTLYKPCKIGTNSVVEIIVISHVRLMAEKGMTLFMIFVKADSLGRT